MASSKTGGTKNKKNARPSSESQNHNEMKTTEIRDLIDFIAQSGLNEVDIETKELKLHVKREPDQKVMKSPVMAAAPMAMAAPAPVAAAPAAAPKAEKAAPAPVGKNTVEIKSPMIGTFYRSSNPDSPPFASVGDKVTKGQVVCIIEAMKLFNEIESEVSGTIVKAMIENSSPVEYDQVLFVVEPD
ncbi:acetyl-CoA carboxylase, biotin carboxyl carrier protein [Cytophagales bacterium WSM2-2]|nr:acetyl-CoA carboxylase, biotin carboxyl carrier protein [Cytophagales bacterium WSM2-2]